MMLYGWNLTVAWRFLLEISEIQWSNSKYEWSITQFHRNSFDGVAVDCWRLCIQCEGFWLILLKARDLQRAAICQESTHMPSFLSAELPLSMCLQLQHGPFLSTHIYCLFWVRCYVILVGGYLRKKTNNENKAKQKPKQNPWSFGVC